MSHPTLVADASVAVRWILPEEGHNPALRVQDLHQEENRPVYDCLYLVWALEHFQAL